MSQIKEAIELVFEIFAITDNDEPDDGRGSFPKIKKLADQALAILHAEPTPAEKSKKDCDNYIYLEADGEIINEHIEKEKALESHLDRSEASRQELLTVCANARLSIKIMSVPRLDNRVASNDDLLQIMDASFEAAIAKAKEGGE